MVWSREPIEFVLFGKKPVVGRVKTRLIPSDPDLSNSFYKAFLKDFSKRYQKFCGLKIRPLIDDKPKQNFLNTFFPQDLLLSPIYQEEGSLFKRLALGISKIEAPYFFLTGTDLPDFPFHYLKDVQIDRKLVTVGLDEDGGFYFFGGPKSCAPLLGREPKSSLVGEELIKNFKKEGYIVYLINKWSDIDTLANLKESLEKDIKGELKETRSLFESKALGL